MGHRSAPWVPAMLCLAIAPAFGCGGEDAPTDLYELSGYVTEAMSGDTIGGARVTFTSDTLYTASATTDDDGLYEMVVETDTPFGQVRAEKSGYVTADRTVYFDVAERRVDIVLRPEPSMD